MHFLHDPACCKKCTSDVSKSKRKLLRIFHWITFDSFHLPQNFDTKATFTHPQHPPPSTSWLSRFSWLASLRALRSSGGGLSQLPWLKNPIQAYSREKWWKKTCSPKLCAMYEAQNKTRLAKWKVQAKCNKNHQTRGIDSLSFLGQPCLLTLVPSMIHFRFCNCIFPRVIFLALFSAAAQCGPTSSNVSGCRHSLATALRKTWVIFFAKKRFWGLKKKGNVLERCHDVGTLGAPYLHDSKWNWKTLSNHPLVPSRHVARLEHPLLHLTRCGCAKLIGCFQDNLEFLSSIFVSQND